MAEDTCATCGEDRPIIARGLCTRCYQRAAKADQLDQHPRTRATFEQNMQAARNAETADGCRPWPTVTRTGYPTAVKVDGRQVSAHVAAWTAENGPVPPGHTLDHECHTDSDTCPGGTTCPHRRCVRATHLTPVTPVEQQRRRRSYRSPNCGRGHPRRGNTRMARDSRGNWYRQCRACGNEDQRTYRAKEAAS